LQILDNFYFYLQVVEIALTVLLFCFVCLQFTLFVSLLNISKQKHFFISNDQYPNISILVAARNEENNIIDCLKSLELIDYPKNKIEILIGNDQSTDKTEQLVFDFIQNKTNFKLVNIPNRMGNARAKANVLAHLFEQSTHEIIFVTDADIHVNANWIKSIVPYFNNPKTGIVSGTTIVSGKGFFAKMQSIDWLYFSGLLIAFDNLGLKSTAVGNNMAVSKKAYLATGGYQNLDFSVTEDLALFKAIKNQGYESINLLEYDNLNQSKPQLSIINFLHQRKRWLIGAQGLNLKWKAVFMLMAMFYPMLILLFFFNTKNALTIWICKVILQFFITIIISIKLKKIPNLLYLTLFEIYTFISTFIISIFYILPIKMIWKNRKY
jgi:cellulose synthase/poly-beta-1,6-N-acetylglucosamine synthase-like glycosyltransferase